MNVLDDKIEQTYATKELVFGVFPIPHVCLDGGVFSNRRTGKNE